MLGLPDHVTACLFDMDGVLTQTATVHNAAWTETFDEFLRRRSDRTGEPFTAFDPHSDYPKYVDGRTRADGVRTFLGSRNITLPEGQPDDPPDADTINGVGNRKNVILLRRIKEDGVAVYDGSVDYLRAARARRISRSHVMADAHAGGGPDSRRHAKGERRKSNGDLMRRCRFGTDASGEHGDQGEQPDFGQVLQAHRQS